MAYTFEQLKSMGAVPGNQQPPASSVAPAPVSAPATQTPKRKYTYDELISQGATPVASSAQPAQPSEKKPNMLAAMAKGIFGAPATLIARPFQAVAALGGASNDKIDEFTNKIPVLGDLIADSPDTFKDVKKDVGRGIQTVALGTAAPIAGGAAFGIGSSLEQGNDLLSAETAINAAVGGAAGKVLEWVGKPLLNAAGKVVGTITPKVIKDVAAGGAQSIQKFMDENQLLGGAFSPASQKIATGFQAVDDKIVSGAKSLATGAGKVVKEQYPQANLQKHYETINERDLIRPTTVNQPKYSKATRIYDDAKGRSINLEKVANERGIIHDRIAEGGKYNTLDTVDNIREGNYQMSDAIARPAIKAAEGGVQRVPIADVRAAMLKRIDDIPTSQITAQDRDIMRRQIVKRYGDTSPVALENPDGFSLTSLHDNRIIAGKNGKFKPGADPSSARLAQLSREEARVFADIFDKTIPEEVGMQAFRKEMEKNFLLADYLEALHGKSVPAGITKKAVRLFGKAAAATLGGKVGGFPGSILGAQYGDILFNSFEALPNPIKMKVLESVRRESPKVFKELVKYIGEKEAQRLLTPLLPPAGGTSFKPETPRLFTTPGGRSTPVLQEALDIDAVESGRIKAPGTKK